MMLKRVGLALVLGLGVAVCEAGAPLKLEGIAPAASLVAEVADRVDEVAKGLESAEGYKDSAKTVKQAASVIAILGQTLTELPEDSPLKAAGPSLRDAAITIARAKTYEEAHAGLPKLVAAAKGDVNPEAVAEFDWAKLSRMHPTMEELNGQATKFRRVLRRPKDPEAESRHVALMALVAVTVYADTHEVKNPADLPKWHEFATAFHGELSQSAVAMRAGETEKAGQHFTTAMQQCAKCHEQFKK